MIQNKVKAKLYLIAFLIPICGFLGVSVLSRTNETFFTSQNTATSTSNLIFETSAQDQYCTANPGDYCAGNVRIDRPWGCEERAGFCVTRYSQGWANCDGECRYNNAIPFYRCTGRSPDGSCGETALTSLSTSCCVNTGGAGSGGGVTLPGGCDCGVCDNWSCHGPSGNGETCVPNPGECGYTDGVPNKACRPSSCCQECEQPCSDCACVAPSDFEFVSPPPEQVIAAGIEVRWSFPTSMGRDQGQTGGDGCSGCSYSGDGGFRFYVNGVDESTRCAEEVGGFIPDSANTCTLESISTSWTGRVNTFEVEAFNTCNTRRISQTQTVTQPSNEAPQCNNFTRASSDRFVYDSTSQVMSIEKDQPFTLRFSISETDMYGNPSDADVCYAIGGQTSSFYQGGLASYRCFGSISGPNTSLTRQGNTLILRTTQDDMISNYNVTNAYSGTIDDQGFVLAINVFDNLDPTRFCSGNPGYNSGNGVLFQGAAVVGDCEVSACKLSIRNIPPNLVSESVSSNLVGTFSEDDNAHDVNICRDNNPVNFQATIEDENGSGDIDTIQFSLADQSDITNPINNGSYNWPFRLQFSRTWKNHPQRFVTSGQGAFMVRDMTVESAIPNNSSTRNCYTATQSTVPIDPTGWDTNDPTRSYNALNRDDTVWCFGYDEHTWENASRVSNVLIPQTTIVGDVYFLRNDIEVYNEGYAARVLGAPNGSSDNWYDGSYVFYDDNSDNVYVSFKVAFIGPDETDIIETEGNPNVSSWINNKWNGDFKRIWHIKDHSNTWDKTIEPGLNAFARNDQWGNTFQVFNDSVKFDTIAPDVSLNPPQVVSATVLSVPWNTNDTGGSGVIGIYGEAEINNLDASFIDRAGVNPLAYDPNADNEFGEKYLWRNVYNSITANIGVSQQINIGANDEGTLNFLVESVDAACNASRAGESQELFQPWTVSHGGLVYSEEGYSDTPISYADTTRNILTSNDDQVPYNVPRTRSVLGSELIFSQSAVLNKTNIGGDTSLANALTYTLTGYTNDESSIAWYSALNDRASRNALINPDIVKAEYSGAVSTSSTISSTFTECSDDKVCLVEVSGPLQIQNDLTCDRRVVVLVAGDITINANILAGANDNGCILISSGQIEILDGTDVTPVTETSPRYDTLEAYLIANSQINIPEADLARTVRDGLKVRGGLIGLSAPSDENALLLERSLRLRNNSEYPTELAVYDPRYLYIAAQIFGGQSETYKTEVGLK